MFVVEYVNSCCFTHDDPVVYKKYKTLAGAMRGVKSIESLTKAEMEKQDMWMSNIRIIDLDNYPKEVYYSKMEKFLYEYEDTETPEWIVYDDE